MMKIKQNNISTDALKWFKHKVESIKNKLNINIPIYTTDFRKNSRTLAKITGYILNKGIDPLYIKVDTFVVQECYDYEVLNKSFPNYGQTLNEIICHEIAHITYRRHCKKHQEAIEILLFICGK